MLLTIIINSDNDLLYKEKAFEETDGDRYIDPEILFAYESNTMT